MKYASFIMHNQYSNNKNMFKSNIKCVWCVCAYTHKPVYRNSLTEYL